MLGLTRLGMSMTVEVLLSLAPPDGTTKFVDQLTEGKHVDTQYRYFSWRTALLGRYQVFHVHWPEQLVRAPGALTQIVKRILFRLLLLRFKLSGIAVVRTLHNLQPHEEGDSVERRLLGKLDAATQLNIRLNAATPMDESTGVTILHGHYIGRYPGVEPTDVRVGRLLYFGLIRPYKGVERLLDIFQSIQDDTKTLRVVGRPTPELRSLIEAVCEQDERVSARLQFVPDDVLASEIYASELVVLPYKEMHNSGAILVALSLARPVLAPRSPTNELLAEEVGPGWVNMFDGDLSEAKLLAVLEEVRSLQRNPPKLSGRDWGVVGRQHHAAYLRAIELRKAS
ncbi:GDP-mannose--glycolipid 4-beta-D-mannosyltransferase [Stenotrophomonas sp. ZAC14D1_NAIMI4_6]|nr:GDP-mannose--glycolipid 4-beta-D-mannosyltransferase [Stenotrophomonas sp. ZAC14D1_NAIMI4_6]AWH43026.1 GDP-mannose--glycolipid 4-beta-D-mannosyltransferase [Stenotrophomonas sp. ZAC14D1_NAIMI4_1]